ncbi:hypothetical protein C7271_26065 [filamentous cyanobacterium CCP5]|nr:hypothetical protein C7271_26065 [filamentous cyanobacterium CCP5]
MVESTAKLTTWVNGSEVEYLEDFVFDVLNPASRHQLVRKICRQQAKTEGELQRLLLQLMAFLPQPFDQVGTFPQADSHTGSPYRYSLLDDLGGAFTILKNELWMTRTARDWLQPSTPYYLTVRCEDSAGRYRDMEYAVALEP